jgi:hypothetical protein
MRSDTLDGFQDPKFSSACTSHVEPKLATETDSTSDYLTPSQAARIIPNAGRHPSPAAVVRWISKGAKSRNGSRIKLQAIRRPKEWLTTRAWISDFLIALTKDRTGVKPAHLAEERAEAARARLAAKGF